VSFIVSSIKHYAHKQNIGLSPYYSYDNVKTNINLNYIQRVSTYRAVNTLRLGY